MAKWIENKEIIGLPPFVAPSWQTWQVHHQRFLESSGLPGSPSPSRKNDLRSHLLLEIPCMLLGTLDQWIGQ